MRGSRVVMAAMLLCCFVARERLSGQARAAAPDVPEPYKTTRDQAGHELVKTEEFVVPVGTSVLIKGLEFAGPDCSISSDQERILTQVFNSLEEITENTVNDTNLARVAEFKGMKFEIRGYSTFAGNKGKDKALSEICANVVLNFLATQGTPAWRLRAKGLGSKRSATGITQSLRHKLAVEFSRTK